MVDMKLNIKDLLILEFQDISLESITNGKHIKGCLHKIKWRRKMKKLFTALMCVMMFSVLTGCGNNESSDKSDSEKTEQKEYVDEADIAKVYSDPSKYEGKFIKLTGKVFTPPEKDDDGVYFQMWADPKNNDLNTIVAFDDSSFELSADDYVILEGEISGAFEGKNNFGGSINALKVIATDLKKSSYTEAIAPTLKEVSTNNLVNSQNGVDIAITKVEFAKNETRVYYTVSNNSGSSYSFYDFNMKATQNGKQFETESNYEAKYPSVSGDILNGIKSEGIACFNGLEQKNFDIHFDEGYSDNYDLDFSEFTLSIVVE